MANKQRIVISKTEGEWAMIDAKTTESGNQSTTRYMIFAASKIATLYKECPKCITSASGNYKRREFYISTETFSVLEEIAKKMQRSVASIMDELLLTPLLLPE